MKRFLRYGLSIAALEEFITQGLQVDRYVLWVFTLIPFAVFLVLAYWVRAAVCRDSAGWRGAALFYLAAGGVGLAVEWFVIGLAPWKDRTSPLVLVVPFHAGMFSFWGTVGFGPHLLLDDRPQFAAVRRSFRATLASLMAATYVLAFAAKLSGADKGLLFLACVGPVVVTFLAMNVFYLWYFWARAVHR